MPSAPPPDPSHPTQLPVGSFPFPDGSTLFRVWAPRAKRVDVEILSSVSQDVELAQQRCVKRHAMAPIGFGLFEARVDASAGTDYTYRLDTKLRRADPASRWQPRGVHGPSRVFDPGRLSWSDQAWVPPTRERLVLIQVHVGTYSPRGDFAGVAADVPRLAELGINALQLMPIAEFPGQRNWGYDGVFPYAVESTYGGPEGLAALVDTCHRHGVALYLDLVFNHLGPEGDYTADFAPYSNSRFHTPWGKALNFDEPGSSCVRRFFLDNALYWSRDFHVDGFRFDAIAQIVDSSAIHVLREINGALPPAHVSIAESELNANRVLAATSGGLGFDAQWNDDFHHALVARLTGNRSAFLADFDGTKPLEQVLRSGWALSGAWNHFRQRFHGEPCQARPDQLVVFSQNHDQVAGIGGGRRAGSLGGSSEQELLLVLTLLSGFVPMLFQGQDFGASTGFHYFVDHRDPALVRRVVAGRRHEQRQLSPTARPPSPASLKAWANSCLNWEESTSAAGEQCQERVRNLLALRRRHGCFRASPRRKVQVCWEGDWLVVSSQSGRSHGLLVAYLPAASKDNPADTEDETRDSEFLRESTLRRWARVAENGRDSSLERARKHNSLLVAYRTERVAQDGRDFVFVGPGAIVVIDGDQRRAPTSH